MKKFNKVLRTKPHSQFAESSKGEVWNKFAEIGFKKEYEYEFVKDMANYYSYERIGEDPNSCFLNVKSQMKEEIEYYKNNGTKEEMQKVQEKFQYHKNIQNFISGIDWEKYSGSSPLDKAAYVTSLLSSIEGGVADENEEIDDEKKMDVFNQEVENEEDVFDEDNNEESEDSSDQEESNNGESSEQEDQNNQESNDESESEDKDQSEQESESNSDQNGSQQEQESESSEGEPSQDKSNEQSDSLQQLLEQQAQELQDGQEVPDPNGEWGSGWSSDLNQVLEKLVEKYRNVVETSAGFNMKITGLPPEIAASTLTLDQEKLIDKLSILADRGEIKSDKMQKKINHNRMTEYSQLNTMSNISQAGLPTFMYKLATKQLMVKRPDQSSKQSLVLLIDVSGSMNTYQKLEWVKAIILNRLDAVIKQKAELFIVFFERVAFIDQSSKSHYSYKKVRHIKTKKEAIEMCLLNWMPSFNGGGTNIQKAIEQVCECIDNGKIGHYSFGGTKPQIVVMNDGQDRIDPSFTPKYTTHGFILGQNNQNMKKMCTSSGGIYKRFL